MISLVVLVGMGEGVRAADAVAVPAPASAPVATPAVAPAGKAASGKKASVKNASAKRMPKVSRKKVETVTAAVPSAEAVATAPAESPVPTLKAAQSLAAEPVVPVAPPPALSPAYTQGYVPRPNPYLVNPYQAAPTATSIPAPPAFPQAQAIPPQAGSGFRLGLPQIPLFEQSILPKVQTVYPTGEKPLVVVTFKCPTELVGIDTPSTLILHKVVNGSMDIINKTNLLSFNMQQVCQ